MLAQPHKTATTSAMRRFSGLFLIAWGIRILVILVVLWILTVTGVL